MDSLIEGISKVSINQNQNPFDILKKYSDKMLRIQNDKNIWKGSVFESLNDLKVDYSGKVGEVFVSKICKLGGIECTGTGDVNSKDGTYDLLILNKKIEVKTARIGGGKFQHENLKSDGCDYYLFLDITPGMIYITILPRFDLSTTNEIIKTRPTLRKGTTDVYKWDFTEKHLSIFEKAGKSITILDSTILNEVSKFIKKNILENENIIPKTINEIDNNDIIPKTPEKDITPKTIIENIITQTQTE